MAAPERQPLKIKVQRKLPIRVTRKFPIKVKAKEKPADEPAMSMAMRVMAKETEEQRKRREEMERRAEELRQRVARRDPSMRTTTRLPYRERTEQTLYDLVFNS